MSGLLVSKNGSLIWRNTTPPPGITLEIEPSNMQSRHQSWCPFLTFVPEEILNQVRWFAETSDAANCAYSIKLGLYFWFLQVWVYWPPFCAHIVFELTFSLDTPVQKLPGLFHSEVNQCPFIVAGLISMNIISAVWEQSYLFLQISNVMQQCLWWETLKITQTCNYS